MFTLTLTPNRSDDLPAITRHVRYERSGDRVTPYIVEKAWIGGKWTTHRVRRARWRDVVDIERIPDDQRQEALWVMREVADLYRAANGCGFEPCSCAEVISAGGIPTEEERCDAAKGVPRRTTGVDNQAIDDHPSARAA